MDRPQLPLFLLFFPLLAGLPTVPLRAQEPPVVRGELGQKIDSVARAAQTRGFHGNLLVASGGQVVLLQSYGMANQESGIPFSPSTVVQIGSNVKDITKISILQLVEAGRLSLDDSLGRFFPKAPPDKRGITVGQLMEHRAGFPMGVGPDEEPLSRDAFLGRLFARRLDFSPGTASQYSNAGYSVLAAIIEQLTGQSFEAQVAESIFRRAGMYETGLLLPQFKPGRLAHCYDGDRDRGTMLDKPHTVEGHYWNLRGNGGFVATLMDMHRFYQALRGTTLLSDSAHRAMVLRPDEPSLLAGSDGYCFFILGNFPQAGVEIIVATNHAGFKAPALMDELEQAAGIPVRGGRREVVAAPGGVRSRALPETGAGRTVAAYVEAFNSGDTTRMRRFFETHALTGPQTPPMAARVSRTLQMRADLGRLAVESVRQTTTGLEVVVTGERGERATLSFDIEPVAPFRMQGLRVEVGSE
jgi:CubicO group peptidase (beta-lactamase class C family)